MDPVNAYDGQPFRPGASPILDTVSANLQPQPNNSPQWDLITPAIARWLRYHFSDSSRIENQNLVARIWKADETTQIIITSLAEWKPENSNQRPAVLIDRLEQNRDMSKRAIGDQFMGVRPGAYSFLMSGAHVVHSIGGREGEAEILAKEVWRELVKFAPIVRPKLCLERLLPMQVGKRQLLDEHKQTYTVPIPIQYAYWETWRVYPTDEQAITAIVTSLTNRNE